MTVTNRLVQRGHIDRWALTGCDLQRVRKSHGVSVHRLALSMGVSVYRVEQLEGQPRTTRETVVRYLAAVDDGWRNPDPPMSAEQKQAWNERRDAERQRERERQHERYQRKHDVRDQEHEHRDRWYVFLREFKANAPAAFLAHCLEVAEEPQPDSVGEELTALYERLAREHHVTYPLAALVRELEARAWFVRAGRREVLVQVRDRPARGHRPAPPRMGTALVPTFDVWCSLSPYGRWLAQAQEAMHGAV